MEKVMVEIYVPAAGKCFDVNIPLNLKIHEVISMLSAGISDFAEEYFSLSNQTTLCDRDTGAILNVNITVKELGLKNGSKLMLI